MSAVTTPTPITHGTYAGYQKHAKRHTEPCDACRKAAAEYRTHYRITRPEVEDFHQDKAKCRDRALRRLAAIHPQDMAALYTDELTRAGFTS